MGLITTSLKVIIAAYLSRSIYLFLTSHGIGIYHNNIHPGKCRIVPNISCGSEQILITHDGLAFITSGYKGMTRCNPKYTEGSIYTFDLNNPDESPKKLKFISTRLEPLTFDPHGMDIVENVEKGTVDIYVVNHGGSKDTIEVFLFDKKYPTEIIHTRTIENNKFVCLNDITVVDENTFYVTNFLKYCRVAKLMLTIELILNLKDGNIIYYNNGESKNVYTGHSLNGITLSKDRTKVVTVQMGTREVFVFNRQENGDLELSNKAFLGYSPDNIFLDKQTGRFYVAYFKDPFSVQMVSGNRTAYASAAAAMVTVTQDGGKDAIDVKEVFYDRGENFVSVSSSFAHYKGHYLIGTVFDKLGYCKKE